MSFLNQFLKMMPYTVTLAAPTGVNAQGMPTFVGAVDTPYRARIVGPVQDLRSPGGATRAELYTVWVNTGSLRFTAEWRLTLPTEDPWNGQTPIIFAVNFVTDEFKMHHAKITCGFMYHRQGQT